MPPVSLDIDTSTTCFHCGDVCPTADIRIEEKVFCCRGCQAVYEILQANDLLAYYELEKQRPGRAPRRGSTARKFEFLDDPAIAHELLDFADHGLARATFRVPAMHCSSCIWLLENLHRLKPGIVRSQVNFPRKEVTITYRTEAISLREGVELLTALGYEPLLHVPADTSPTSTKSDRQLYYRMGIAGFAFGNIMLFSFPEYLAAGAELEPLFRTFFRYASLILSLPVFFYSSLEYFQSAWRGLKHRFLNIDVPIALGIITLYGRSLYEIITMTGSGYLDSFSGLVFFLLIGKVFQKKTYDALSFDLDYRSYFPLAVTILDKGKEHSIPLSRLQVGNRLLIRNQELIPADSVLLHGTADIDYSFVTGEADPVNRNAGDLLHAGGRVIGPSIEVEVTREVSQSYLTRLWNHDVFTKPPRARLSRKVNVVSKYFTTAVLAVATLAAGYWLTVDASMAARVFTAVLIVACPCALALATPFTLGTTQRIFGRHDFYLKNAEAVEVLAGIDTIVFDKTGTLTQSGPTTVTFHGAPLTQRETDMIRSLSRQSTHALSRQIHASLTGNSSLEVRDFEEWPGQGIQGRIQGIEIRLGSAEWVQVPTEITQPIKPGDSLVHLALAGQYRGLFLVSRTFREGLDRFPEELGRDHRLLILSGDTDRDEPELRRLLGNRVEMHFGQSPEAKMDFIRRLQAEGRHVLMVGDGLNDAGALKASQMGVSVAEENNMFSPACDGIIAARSFPDFPKWIRFSRASLTIIFISFGISFLYNTVGLGFAVSGLLSPLVSAILMPASSISVVAFTTLATRLTARTFGMD